MSKHTHLAAIARQTNCKLYALKARIEHDTIAGAIDDIRSRRHLTHKAARAAYDAAESGASMYLHDCRRHDYRAANASVAPLHELPRDQLARRLLPRLPGKYYPGNTSWNISACEPGRGGASTSSERGERYSPGCSKYYPIYKTDATHTIQISLHDLYHARYTLGLPREIDGMPVVEASIVRPGIYRCKLLYSRGMLADTRIAYCANQGSGMWHVATTERGAVTALNRATRQREAAAGRA